MHPFHWVGTSGQVFCVQSQGSHSAPFPDEVTEYDRMVMHTVNYLCAGPGALDKHVAAIATSFPSTISEVGTEERTLVCGITDLEIGRLAT